MEHFSAVPQANINSSKLLRQPHALFHFFLCNDSKHDVFTTTVYSKLFISLIKVKNVLTTPLSTIWENTDGCVEQYRCASSLFLMSVMS